MRGKQQILPDNFTLPFVLKACVNVLDFVLGVQVHGIVLKIGLEKDVFVKTGLVSLYGKCGELRDAEKVFDDIPQRNVVSWTAIISGYIRSGKFKEGIDVFKKAIVSGELRPDSYTLVRVLSACSKSGDLSAGEWIHQYLVYVGLGKNVFVSTSLVNMYAKFGDMEKARSVFDEMPEKDIVPWSAMIQGYAANGHPKEALEMFYCMQRENLGIDRYTIVGVLSACASLGALDVGEWAVGLMDRSEFLSNPVMGTALINMYSKCGNMISAWEIFKGMKVKDIVLWNTVISSLAMNGHVNVVFACFGEIEKCGIQPNENTFIGLLCGCTHAGLVEDGRRFFHSMRRVYSLEPTIEHYGCMTDLLGRAGLLEEAHSLIKDMPMQPNSVVWGALLGGCRLCHDTDLAEYVLKKLIELEPWNSGHYVLLSNIYSTNRKFDDSENIRSIMNEKGMKKIPAYSWIELDGVVHEFLVGDTSHPMSDKIYAKLGELANKLREAGYAPTTEFVLFDVEEEEKEHVLGYHSEKLALAFGLITSKPNEVIRITKNLRVCGDCHAAFKLVSKMTGKDIIVRDNNRFHLFSDGSCSCRDYW
ncbi:hypothetical protein Leryth_023231 [Lithospermum erythrorhizon]|nr:hypothetical protein Leryth_023231 [Lithospermum erythrorhizon]